jgi:hypothetical protein
MPRGIPWDDLTLFREKKIAVDLIAEADSEPEPRDFQKDAWNIGKRAAFGLVVLSQSISHHFLTPVIFIRSKTSL